MNTRKPVKHANRTQRFLYEKGRSALGTDLSNVSSPSLVRAEGLARCTIGTLRTVGAAALGAGTVVSGALIIGHGVGGSQDFNDRNVARFRQDNSHPTSGLNVDTNTVTIRK